jgi:SAM-dependent methyltransferase
MFYGVTSTPKRYDESYFRRWYGGPGTVAPAAALARRARLALAAAEYVLERPVRSVLDVGCGEGRWRAALVRARPGLLYVGVDPSEYVVRRHGRRRGIRLGSLAELAELRLRRRFDLIVCSDVAHYVPDTELGRGLAVLRRLARGALWMDAFTTADAFEGDRDGWQRRGPRDYRRMLARAGFVACGLNCWVVSELADRLSALERADERAR